MPLAYYNEHDPFAAAWLRELISAGHIAPGEVDERDIRDVCPADLAGFVQHHFFAGIGVWSYALRCAGWPDDRAVWTGSCPCQPFSQAGAGAGFADERHLWPVWHHHLRVCRPGVVFGEQVESKDGCAWLDLVQADLEGLGYACGAVVIPAAGFGAPHIRHRLFFVAESGGQRCPTGSLYRSEPRHQARPGRPVAKRSFDRGVADPDGWDPGTEGLQRCREHGQQQAHRSAPGRLAQPTPLGRREVCANAGGRGEGSRAPLLDQRPAHGGPLDLGDPGSAGLPARQSQALLGEGRGLEGGAVEQPGPTSGFWRDADWLPCRDGKARPVEPGTFPLAHGAPARVGRLRGYGNALCAPAAEAFIAAYLDGCAEGASA